jgi:pyridoxamine 5'-phosphate oxidase
MGIKDRDPFEIFDSWLSKAEHSETNNPNAMTLATAGSDGRPSARMVLLKDFSPDGFVFYTNLASPKSRQLAENPHAALLFHWKTQDRQIRIEGQVEQVTDAEADAYFATRSRGAKLGAWASHQSDPMNGRVDLEKRVARYTAKFHIGPVPRPDFWSGFRLRPLRIEFWEQGDFRLHRRFLFTRPDFETVEWQVQRLFP